VKKYFIVRVVIFILCILPIRAYADTEKCDIGYWSYQDTTYVFDAVDGTILLIEEPFHLPRANVDRIENNRLYWHHNGRLVFTMCESLVEHPALTEWCSRRAEQILSDFPGTLLEAVITITLTEGDPIIAKFLVDQIQLHANLTSTRLTLPHADYLGIWRGYKDHVLDLCYSPIVDYD